MVFEGDKWGALTCTYAGKVEIVRDVNGTEVAVKTACYVLKCECGNEVRIPKAEFRGKRNMTDCGCGLGIKGGRMMQAISVPKELQRQISEAAIQERMLVSHMWTQLARWGLERWKREQTEIKNQSGIKQQ